MNKFIKEGLDGGHKFIVIEPQEGYNEAIVAFDKGKLVYDVEKLMNCMMDYYDWDYPTAIEWFEYKTVSLTQMAGGPLFFEEEEECYLMYEEEQVAQEVRNKIMEGR